MIRKFKKKKIIIKNLKKMKKKLVQWKNLENLIKKTGKIKKLVYFKKFIFPYLFQ